MGARQFAVERLGIGAWPATTDDADRVISLEAWVRLRVRTSCSESLARRRSLLM